MQYGMNDKIFHSLFFCLLTEKIKSIYESRTVINCWAGTHTYAAFNNGIYCFFLFLRQGHQHLHYYFILKVHNIFKYLFIWPEVAKGNHDTSSSPLRSLIFDNTKNSDWSVSKLIIEHLDWWDNCSSWYPCDYYTFFFLNLLSLFYLQKLFSYFSLTCNLLSNKLISFFSLNTLPFLLSRPSLCF